VLERVQYGGQGIVYKGVQRATKRIVAIKVLWMSAGHAAAAPALCAGGRALLTPAAREHRDALRKRGHSRRNYCAMEFVEGLPIDEYVLLHAPAAQQIVRLFVTSAGHQLCHQRGSSIAT